MSKPYLLMGLRYSSELTDQLLEGVRAMEESSTYQALLVKGEAKEARKILLRQGTKRFGPPSAQTEAALQNSNDVPRLENMIDRLSSVSSWEELLDAP